MRMVSSRRTDSWWCAFLLVLSCATRFCCASRRSSPAAPTHARLEVLPPVGKAKHVVRVVVITTPANDVKKPSHTLLLGSMTELLALIILSAGRLPRDRMRRNF